MILAALILLLIFPHPGSFTLLLLALVLDGAFDSPDKVKKCKEPYYKPKPRDFSRVSINYAPGFGPGGQYK